MDFSKLKNKEAQSFLKGINLDEIYDIHENDNPSSKLTNLMMAVMLLIDFQ